jgi:hypothetical protein
MLLSHPFFILFTIIFLVVFYFLYDNYFRYKKEIPNNISVENTKAEEIKEKIYIGDSEIKFSDQKPKSKLFKKIVLWGTLVVAIWVAFVLSTSSGPGEGMVALVLLWPVMPIIYIFYPVYFIILSIRYHKEGKAMDLLDKIMFYILAVPIISLGVFSVYKIYSDNAIQNLLTDRQQRNERKVALVDLTVKDINYSYNNLINVEFCNDAKIQRSSFAGFFSINIESDKNSSFIIKKNSAPVAGGCTYVVISPSSLGLKIGDITNITITMDSENEITEITKENNKMTKRIILGKRQGECLETDGGKDFYKRGMVNGELDCCKKSLSDETCPSQGSYIIENYCEDEKPSKEMYECPKGCADGACIE